jgi:predicted enzyme related to lactoylglutathione lyase
MTNAVNQSDLSVKNLESGKVFYQAVIGAEMYLMEAINMKDSGIGGCLIRGTDNVIPVNSPMIYLNSRRRLAYFIFKSGGCWRTNTFV